MSHDLVMRRCVVVAPVGRPACAASARETHRPSESYHIIYDVECMFPIACAAKFFSACTMMCNLGDVVPRVSSESASNGGKIYKANESPRPTRRASAGSAWSP